MNKKSIAKKISITIGIPAYNEEANIAMLLDKILLQKGNSFVVKKIIVVSDSDLDNTNKIVSEYKNTKIHLVANASRKGQVYAQNLIFKLADTDLVVLFEADTYPENEDYLSNLIKPLFKNKNVGLIQGSMQPLKPKTMIAKCLAMQFKIFSKIMLTYHSQKNPIPSGRGGRAFTKTVYKNLIWPTSVPEDEYAYLWCAAKGIETMLQKSAICYFRLPQTVSEYIKSMQKNKSASITIHKYFSSEIISSTMSTSSREKALIFFYFLLADPALCLRYIFLRVAVCFGTKNLEFTDFWTT